VYRQYYDVISNSTLWFLHHGLYDLPRRPRFDRRWWEAWSAFRSVNHSFAALVAAEMAQGATVLVQDYQLSLAAAELLRLRPDLRTAMFHHTAFAGAAALRTLPDAACKELLEGIASNGSVGFHAARWESAYREASTELIGRAAPTFVSPGAADVGELTAVAASSECDYELARLEDSIDGRQLVVDVSRMELSKNLLRGFHVFDDLLERRPEWRGRVVFAAFVYPTRESLSEYLSYHQEVETLATHVNRRWAVPGWTPILLDEADNVPASVAALRRYDVLMVNPLADGLNLVAKEGPIVNERDGVLALCRAAGVWDELGEHAVEVHPFDVAGTSDALAHALAMPVRERRRRAKILRATASRRTPVEWFEDQIAAVGGPSLNRARLRGGRGAR
jgi:trehalose 6-phosphate synthase